MPTLPSTSSGWVPWNGSCQALAASIRRELGRLRGAGRGDCHVTVAPLGVRDELASADPVPDVRERTVPVFLAGRIAIVGPFPPHGPFSPQGHRVTGCPRCLARRWQLNRPDALRDGIERGAGTAAAGVPPFLTGFATTMLAAFIAARLDREDADRYPFVYVFDLATGTMSRTRFVADADCPCCGDQRIDTPEAALVTIEPSPKRAGFRLRPLSDLDLPMDALVNPVCGMVGAHATPMLTLPTTAMVTSSFAKRSDQTLYEIHWGGHANSFETSRLVGVIEGLERYAGVSPRGRRTAVRASLTELGDVALDPRGCGVYSEAFYATSGSVQPFNPERPIDWVWGFSLRDTRPILVPIVLTYYHCAPRSERFVQACSNGCASGSSLVEAIYFGLSEVVERDAFLLAWYGQLALPEIDPMTSARSATRIMVDRLRMCGYRARFFDATTALRMPVVVAAAQRLDAGLGALCFGAGAGVDPEEALGAALDEIATDALFLRSRTEYARPALEAMAADFNLVRELHDHPILYGLPAMAGYANFLLGPRPEGQPPLLAVSALRPPSEPNADLADDVRACVASISAEGFDVIVVDHTSPEQRGMGLYTASVLVPGLLPIDFGWQRQRALTMPRLHTAASRGPGTRSAVRVNPAPHPFP
jgi:ribosomal protein S12 methylthiotransferase accessory factor